MILRLGGGERERYVVTGRALEVQVRVLLSRGGLPCRFVPKIRNSFQSPTCYDMCCFFQTAVSRSLFACLLL